MKEEITAPTGAEPRMLSADEVRDYSEYFDLNVTHIPTWAMTRNLCYTVDRLREALGKVAVWVMSDDEGKWLEDSGSWLEPFQDALKTAREALDGKLPPPNNDAEIARLAREYVRAWLEDTDGASPEKADRNDNALHALIAAVEQEGR